MDYIEIPMSAFLIIEPLTKECYGIDRHTISEHICDSVDARTLRMTQEFPNIAMKTIRWICSHTQ